jgi:hypothetical protein
MLKSQWRDSTMVKTLCYIAFSPSYHRVFTIVLSRHCVFTIVPSCFHHHATVFSPSYHRVFTIAASLFHRRAIAFSSPFHHRNIAFSPSYHRVFTIVPSCHRVFTIMHRDNRLNKKSRLSKRNTLDFLLRYWV